MSPLLPVLIALFCLGCGPAQETETKAVDPAPVEAVRPTGPYAVGVMDGPALANGVESRLYYPAATSGGVARVEVLTTEHQAGLARRFGAGVAEALGRAVTVARRDAPPADGRFPLVIFTPGAAMGASDYRLLLEGLVSRGYVLLALNPHGSPGVSAARYEAAADELVAALAAARSGGSPALAVVDPAHAAFVGHSLGGAAAVMALSRAPGVAAVNLDGDLEAAPSVPASASVLYLLGQTDGESGRSRSRRAGVWRDLSVGVSDAVALQVVTLKHFDFADAALLQQDVPQDRRSARFGAIGGRAAHDLTVDLVAGFLDSRLKGEADAWAAAVARHPEAARPSTW